MTTFELPFPSSKLSGHHDAHWRMLQPVKKAHRQWAHLATLEARPSIPDEGDIRIKIEFFPPNRRGDRTNYPNRLKPYFDGIADALHVNDRRFLPSYEFGPVVPDGKVVVTL